MKYRHTWNKNKTFIIVVAVILLLVEVVIFLSGFLVGKMSEKRQYTLSQTEQDFVQSMEFEVIDGAGAENNTDSKNKTPAINDTENSFNIVQKDGNGGNESAEEKVQKLLDEMTLSDKIYQMMFVTPETITGMGTVTQAGETTKKALKKYPVGGLVYFSNNFENREQTVKMIANTQKYSEIPLFIGVDEEGGRVARLGSNRAMGTTLQPAMAKVGQSGDTQKAYQVGQTLAKDLSALGFNVDFAPDADVLINPDNTEIGDRSFGSDPDLVAGMVSKTVEGLQNGGVSATLKHFPGHGSTYLNSHSGYSESTRTLDELRANEFLPFSAGINSGVDFVMISHMTLVNATTEKVPSSVSKEVITDMLIGELGYKGIIITDSFAMGAVTDMYSPAQAAVKAVQAGADMILMTPDIDSAHSAILRAVESGQISQNRIEDSVRKILSLKIKKGMIK